MTGCKGMLGTTCCCDCLNWPLLPNSRATPGYHHSCLTPVHTAAGGPPEVDTLAMSASSRCCHEAHLT